MPEVIQPRLDIPLRSYSYNDSIPPTPPLSDCSSISDSSDELTRDCFRSMRGISCLSDSDLTSAMKSDASELSTRLKSIRKQQEKWAKVFDKNGQGYTVTVHAREVNLCYMDDKGEYHHHIFGDGKQRRASIASGNGHTLVEISPKWVKVYHASGVWRCRRVMGKVIDSSTKPKTEQIVGATPKTKRKNSNSIILETHGAEQPKKELLLCSNTPPERLSGEAPRAFKSQFHDL